MALTRLQRTK